MGIKWKTPKVRMLLLAGVVVTLFVTLMRPGSYSSADKKDILMNRQKYVREVQHQQREKAEENEVPREIDEEKESDPQGNMDEDDPNEKNDGAPKDMIIPQPQPDKLYPDKERIGKREDGVPKDMIIPVPKKDLLYPDKERIGIVDPRPGDQAFRKQIVPAGDTNVDVTKPRRKVMFNDKLVHLDLKGAPPKISYLKELFPLFKRLGATGLLIEYEDMFPYSGDLELVRAPDAYSMDDINSILKEAEQNGLMVIPLVQTFGHMEFVLKHKQFNHLKEIYPQGINPAHSQSLKVVTALVDQVMAAHPGVKYLHIGCDEVYHLGLSNESKSMMKQLNSNREQVFFRHVLQVAQHVRQKYKVQPIIWDDMFRKINASEIKKSGIQNMIEPMVWCYRPNVEERLDPDMWQRYAEVFPNIWFASAFKGATGAAMFITNSSHHLQNHIGWIRLAEKLPEKVNLRGIALTGWQRYDHFGVLCELLPVGLPSLAVCLKVLQSQTFGNEQLTAVSKDLGCDRHLDIKLKKSIILETVPKCSFPGASMFQAVHVLHNTKQMIDKIKTSNVYLAWFSAYHRKYNFTNPGRMNYLLLPSANISAQFAWMLKYMPGYLSDIYDEDTVTEWMEQNVLLPEENFKNFVEEARRLMHKDVPEKRPVAKRLDKKPDQEIKMNILLKSSNGQA